MMKSPFSDTQRAAILKQADEGKSVRNICCEHSISNVTFYRWRRDARNATSRALISETPATQKTAAPAPEVKATAPRHGKRATAVGPAKDAAGSEIAKAAA